MPSSVEYSRRALHALKRMPRPTSQLIRQKIELLAGDRRSQAANAKMLKDYDGIFRLRVGDWRIFYRDNIDVLQIVDVRHRQEAYTKGKR